MTLTECRSSFFCGRHSMNESILLVQARPSHTPPILLQNDGDHERSRGKHDLLALWLEVYVRRRQIARIQVHVQHLWKCPQNNASRLWTNSHGGAILLNRRSQRVLSQLAREEASQRRPHLADHQSHTRSLCGDSPHILQPGEPCR